MHAFTAWLLSHPVKTPQRERLQNYVRRQQAWPAKPTATLSAFLEMIGTYSGNEDLQRITALEWSVYESWCASILAGQFTA